MSKRSGKKSDRKVALRLFMKTLVYSVKMMFGANKLAAILITFVQIIQAVLPSIQAIFVGLTLTELAQLNWRGFLIFIILAVGLSIVRDLLAPVTGYFSQVLRYDIQNFAVEKLYLKVGKIPLKVRETKENADALEIAESYGLNLGWLFPQFVSIVSQIFAMIVAFIVLAKLNWLIALFMIVIVAPSGILVFRKVLADRKMWKSNSLWRRKGWGVRNQFTHPGNLIELKLNGLFDYFVREWRKFISRDRETIMAVDKKFLPWETGFGGLGGVLQLAVLIWAGKLIINGSLAIGFIVTIKNLMDNLSGSLQSVMVSISQVGDDLLNAKDYFAYLDLPEEEDGSVRIVPNYPLKIEFRDVSFTYPLAEAPAISQVSIVIEPGEGVALVGENGSGKTTLIKLLLGLYEPDSGEILVNGHNLRDVNKASYYKMLGALFQDFAHYDFATLEENIWYGDISRKPREDDFREVIERAKLTSTVAKLPHGLKQILSKQFDKKNGTDLSGGQWQRLALARGFWREPQVLILDEPTASVDAKAEYEIFKEIGESQKGRTTIIISHRFSTVRKAEKIFVIAHGKIVERGMHAELMSQGGLYAEMFSLQAEGYK